MKKGERNQCMIINIHPPSSPWCLIFEALDKTLKQPAPHNHKKFRLSHFSQKTLPLVCFHKINAQRFVWKIKTRSPSLPYGRAPLQRGSRHKFITLHPAWGRCWCKPTHAAHLRQTSRTRALEYVTGWQTTERPRSARIHSAAAVRGLLLWRASPNKETKK
jgi:hypothetical protein